MDGQHRNKRKIIEFLTNWYQDAIDTESWGKMDHFHLDQISKDFKNSEIWLDEVFDIFKMYFDIIDKSKYTIFLCIPLLESETETNITLLDNDYIRKKINNFEPPSFYLEPVDNYNLEQTLNGSLPINMTDFYDSCFEFYYSEQKDDIDGLYYRSIFVIKK
jgi:hypothetical protein